MKKLLFIIFFSLSIVSNAQSNSDSLLTLFKDQIYTDIAAALKTGKQALKLAEEENDSLNIALSKKSIGTAFYFKENHQKAINYLTDAQTTLKQLKNVKEVAYCNNNLALVYKEVGLYKRAAELYFINLKYFDSVKDTFRLCQTYNNLGIIYEKMGDFEDALKYYNYALDINYKDLITKANLFLNIAVVYDFKNQIDTAIIYYHKALEIYKSLEHKTYEAYVYGNLSALYLNNNDFETALKYQQMCYKLEKDENNVQLLTYYNLADIYYKQHKLNDALEYANIAYEQGISSGNQTDFLSIVTLLKNIYKEKGNTQQALKYAEEQFKVKIELHNELKIKEIKKLNIEYETEKKENEIIQLEKEKEIALQKAHIESIYKNIALFGVIITLIMIGLIVNRMRIKKQLFEHKEKLMITKAIESKLLLKNEKLESEKLKSLVESKNRELSSNALATSQKNELLAEVEEKIKSLIKTGQISSGKELQELKLLIKENKNIDNDWENFKVHFDNVHPDFYKKLSTEYSSLSPNDLKHCAYIKVNLSSKEIARIMNISPKSVQMTRYRLKKKFGLTAEQDLIEFVNELS